MGFKKKSKNGSKKQEEKEGTFSNKVCTMKNTKMREKEEKR